MDDSELERYAHFIETHNLTRIEIEDNGTRLVLERVIPHSGTANNVLSLQDSEGITGLDTHRDSNPRSIPEPEKASGGEGRRITAPLLGVVYRTKDPDPLPFVEVGQTVSKGDVLCLIEAMKMYNEITSPFDGVISGIHFENGELVEFGSELFSLV
jgi:biotin carboxyl carrier protein